MKETYYHLNGLFTYPCIIIIIITVLWVILYPSWDKMVDFVTILTCLFALSGILRRPSNPHLMGERVGLGLIVVVCLILIGLMTACTPGTSHFLYRCYYNTHAYHELEVLIQLSLIGIMIRAGYLLHVNKPLEKKAVDLAICVLIPLVVLLLSIWMLIVYLPVEKIQVNIVALVKSELDQWRVVICMTCFVLAMTNSLIPLLFMIFDNGIQFNLSIAIAYALIPWHTIMLSVFLLGPYWFFHDITYLRMEIPECVELFKAGRHCGRDIKPHVDVNGTYTNCCRSNVDGLTHLNRGFTLFMIYVTFLFIEGCICVWIKRRVFPIGLKNDSPV